MELCKEPDIFIGRRSNKFRRYSGLLEYPSSPTQHEKFGHHSKRRVTIDSYDENIKNNVKSNQNNDKHSMNADLTNKELGSKEKNYNESEKEVNCCTPVRRSRRKYFHLNCTFFEDREKENELGHSVLPNGRRYSLRSSLGTFENGLNETSERKIGQCFEKSRGDNEIGGEANRLSHGKFFQRKKSTEISKCLETSIDQNLVFSQRRHSLRSYSVIDLTLNSNEGEEGVRKGVGTQNINTKLQQYGTIQDNFNGIGESHRTLCKLQGRSDKSNKVKRRKSVDMNCTFLGDAQNNPIPKFQTNQEIREMSYTAKSSSMSEYNLRKYMDIGENKDKNGSIWTESSGSAEKSIIEESKKGLIVEVDQISWPNSMNVQNNMDLPLVKDVRNECSLGIYHRCNKNERAYRRKSCGSNSKIIKSTEKTVGEHSFDKNSTFSSCVSFDNKGNESKGFVSDKEPHAPTSTIYSKYSKKFNIVKENRGTKGRSLTLLPYKKTITEEDEYVSVDTEMKTELFLEKNAFDQKELVEKWISSNFNLDSNKQSGKSCNFIEKPGDLKRSSVQYTTKREKYHFESNIESSEAQTKLFSSSKIKGGGKKKNTGKCKKPDSTKPQKKCSSNLETIFEIPEKQLMSTRKFKRSINFGNFCSIARIRRRQMKAKKINSSLCRDIVDVSKLNAMLDKLSLSD